ncbi:hypothetical protein DICPUDRAFT_29357 [Dictyostelium purpureum]|uniref:LysM domain-containing protein n=1 Tax=Dictyostelium purpureum TaxID=5786 RepID=F0ZDG9_DICPU|nr:uncharacterized protein DICPUDRAFT_29357 [Dictyostelium purpureum]EGC37978.1 hypothetical protein DICPUDRAFT_29357 [Dictyostelium purpureum]|eukprot:XP_003285462.1 hypothetical protein DICPUDRAFT_29357 [Dictyostelium purpureum]
MKIKNIILFIYIIQLLFTSVFGAEKKVNGELTFYAAGDNCPPSAEIAYPTTSMPQAGGVGTYSDPITCASASAWFPVHSLVYIPAYKKYFIMADSCEECENEWDDDGTYHIDAWLGPSTVSQGTTNCEVQLSLSNTQFIINPVSTYAVITTPFFQNGTCITPITDPCVDEGNECGNTCQLPSAMSCQAAANLFGITLARFKALNPSLGCTSNIAKGKTVCMSGSCGGP